MGVHSLSLLAADDDAVVRSLVARFGERAGFRVQVAGGGVELLEKMDDEVDVVLLDLSMPKPDGFECLAILSEKYPGVPAVVLSGDHEAENAVKAMKLGAVDYVTKPFDGDELVAVLQNAFRLRKTLRENEELKETIGGGGPKVQLVAESVAMEEVIHRARKVAELDSTVLLTGESGVGKGMLARFIHESDKGDGKPFVTVSCPAVPRELLESELFGHEKGAFTGAVKRRIGKVEAACGGTLFLDEVGELPMELQSKLLSVLQDREFQRVGGEQVIQADVRVIAATNVDFSKKIREGSFREDLYFRLSVIPIEVPPLRDRLEGLNLLVGALLEKVAGRIGQKVVVSDEALSKMRTYHWPGNVRQLENELERAAAFCEQGMIEPKDLMMDCEVESTGLANEGGGLQQIGSISFAEIEKLAIEKTLKHCEGNKAKAARVLEISEKSIYNKMKRLGIH